MSALAFDPEAVRALALILADTGLTEIEIETKEGRIRVARAPAPVAVPVHVQTVAAAPAPALATPALATPALATPGAAPDDAHHPGAVLSPMVGVAFLAPEPGAAPFVAIGQTVAVGQTLLLIEAMKTFNQIRAQQSGTVLRILVEPGQPVEYGQPLLILE